MQWQTIEIVHGDLIQEFRNQCIQIFRKLPVRQFIGPQCHKGARGLDAYLGPGFSL